MANKEAKIVAAKRAPFLGGQVKQLCEFCSKPNHTKSDCWKWMEENNIPLTEAQKETQAAILARVEEVRVIREAGKGGENKDSTGAGRGSEGGGEQRDLRKSDKKNKSARKAGREEREKSEQQRRLKRQKMERGGDREQVRADPSVSPLGSPTR
jgi:hypothetical protein